MSNPQLSTPVNAQNNAITAQRQQVVQQNFANYQNKAVRHQYNMTNATNYASIANNSAAASGVSYFGGALSGAATGASVGSLVPGIGTAVGAVTGALAGVFGAAANNYRQKKAQEYNERQIAKQNAYNSEQAELAHKRQLEQMDYAQAIENAQYEKYYSPAAQKQQLKDAGLSVGSMYATGYQGTSVPSAPAATSPSASSVGAASMPVDSSATLSGVGIDNAHLQLDALSVGANNTRTLADATRISIDNTTANQKNVSEILKNYAEIERLKKAGLLDDATANRITTMLDHDIANVDANTALTTTTAENTAAVMQSTARNNNASAIEHNASSGLKTQQTKTEQYQSDNMRFISYQNNLKWTTEKQRYQISRDICDKYGIDKRFASDVSELITSVAKNSGVELIKVGAQTLFSWLDFSNWKSIFVANKFTDAQRDIAAQNLEQQMKFHNDEMNFRDDDLIERLARERGDYIAAFRMLSKKEQQEVQSVYDQDGYNAAASFCLKLASKKQGRK